MSQANELAPPSPVQHTARFNPRRLRWLILLILVGPCAAIQAPLEVGRWKVASAMQARDAGNKNLAYARLADAMSWMPASIELNMQRLQWRLDDGDRNQALADADSLLSDTKESSSGLIMHSLIMQKLGNFAAAVEDWKKIDQYSQRSGTPKRAEALNGLAYAQAVAKVELDEALQHANDALELIGNDAESRLQILDTRGYLRYLKGQYQLAHDDMNAAIEILDRLELEQIKKRTSKPPQPSVPRLPKRHVRLLRIDLGAFKSPPTKAVLCYHRALVREALGMEDAAQKDRTIARALIGREPDETLF